MTSNIGVAYPPPNPIVQIFNSEYYEYDKTPLTLEDADIRYLKKSGSTATGTIIFNKGLQSANIYGTNGNTNVSANVVIIGDLDVTGNITGITTGNVDLGNITTANLIVQQSFKAESNITSIFQSNGDIGANALLYIDSANNRIGIKDSYPQYPLEVNGDINIINNNALRSHSNVVLDRYRLSNISNIYSGNVFFYNSNVSGNTNITGNLLVNTTANINTANVTNNLWVGNDIRVIANAYIDKFIGSDTINITLPNGTLSPVATNPALLITNNWGVDSNKDYLVCQGVYGGLSGNGRVYIKLGKYAPAEYYSGLNFNGTDGSLDNYAFMGLGSQYSWSANLLTITLHGNVSLPRHVACRESMTCNGSINNGNSTISGNLTISKNQFLSGNLSMFQSSNSNSNVILYVGNNRILNYSPTLENDCIATILPRSGGNAATLGTIGSTGLYGWELPAVGTSEINFTAQLPHSYSEGTNVVPHLHVIWGNNNAGNANITMRYAVLNIGETLGNVSNIFVFKASPQLSLNSNIISYGNVDMTGKSVSCIFNGTIARVGGSIDDDYSGTIYVQSVDLHYQSDKLGKNVTYAQ